MTSEFIRNDLTIYENHASDWWNPKSHYFRSLQSITPFRINLIEEWFGSFKDKDIVDLGCGGGLISIPLLDAGARVTGVDLSAKSIEEVKKKSNGRGTFINGDIRTINLPDESADYIILADVIDHIPDYCEVVKNASRIIRPNGKIFISTLNRTFRSWFFAILLGEGLKLIPSGTHDYKLFVKPDELISTCKLHGFTFNSIIGDKVKILETIRNWAIVMKKGKSTAVAYSMLFQKEAR